MGVLSSKTDVHGGVLIIQSAILVSLKICFYNRAGFCKHLGHLSALKVFNPRKEVANANEYNNLHLKGFTSAIGGRFIITLDDDAFVLCNQGW
jgi:hypothetical protein